MASLGRAAGVALAGLGAATGYRYQLVKAREAKLPRQPLNVFDTTTTAAQKQRVLIVGAGVVGVSTAYKLAQRGHQVAVLEPMSHPGEECSYCAAGGMSRQNVVVDKDSWMAVLKCVTPSWARRDKEFKFFHIDWFASLSDPFFLRWATTFTKTSLFPSHHQNVKQQEMLKFTKYAVQDMIDMFEKKNRRLGQIVGYNKTGSLAVSYDEPEAEPEIDKQQTSKKKDGITQEIPTKLNSEPNIRLASRDQVLQEEPSLRFQVRPPTSAKFEYDARAASSGRFAKELARLCVTDPALDVEFFHDTKVQAITSTNQQGKTRISQLQTNRGVISVPGDVHVVIAAGAWTPHVLALMDLYAPVYPLKGYAMSVSAKEALRLNKLKPQDLPSRIVCDKYMHTTRMGDEIRMTSIGEFSEWNTQPTPHVDTLFRKEACRQFPQLQDLIQQAKTRCGHRPFVSDGLLLLGAVDPKRYDKLYVTAGPGSNGWKLASGSGDIIARLVSGQTPEQIKEELGFEIMAVSPVGRVLYAPLFAKVCRARWNV